MQLTRTIFVFDIDSTIADNNHRAVLLMKHCKNCGALVDGHAHRQLCQVCGCTEHHTPQKCWDAFLEPSLILKDSPIPDAQRLIQQLKDLKMEYIYLTGRNEGLRPATTEWLCTHFGETSPVLWMRKLEWDNMPASQAKERLLKEYIYENRLHPDLDRFVFFEDDTHVFGMYRKYGVVVQCPEGLKYFCPQHATDKEPSWKR